jgi:helicase
LDIIEEYPDDRFLIFAHTKRTGKLMCDSLIRAGHACEFHNADLEKEDRHKLEAKFRSGKLQYIVATSTLAWGLNLPARRVIVLGVHRAMDEVADYDIWQMAGRAGRPGYDPRGDVYILLPHNNDQKHMERLKTPQPIKSKLLDSFGGYHKTLGFHLVSEIHHGNVTSKDDVNKWYERSLAYYQTKEVDEKVVDSTLETLEKCGAVKKIEEKYEATAIGKVSSMFYYSPFDVSDLRRNFGGLFKGNGDDNDLLISMALGNVDSIRGGIVSKPERMEMEDYKERILQLFDEFEPPMDTSIKGGFIYYTMLKGLPPGSFAGLVANMQYDSQRLIAVLNALDAFSGKWDRREWFDQLADRLRYGIREELVPLCRIKGIAKIRAEKLWAAGLRSPYDVANNFDKVKQILNMKDDKIQEIVADAKRIDLVS